MVTHMVRREDAVVVSPNVELRVARVDQVVNVRRENARRVAVKDAVLLNVELMDAHVAQAVNVRKDPVRKAVPLDAVLLSVEMLDVNVDQVVNVHQVHAPQPVHRAAVARERCS